MKELKRRSGGFTLVELIVVLVILAILAALLVPSLTGYIDKANEQSAIVECRACVVAAQTFASQHYGKGDFEDWSASNEETRRSEIKTLAEVPDAAEITEDTYADNAAVTKLVLASSKGVTVTYENGIYTIGSGDGGTSGGILGYDGTNTNTNGGFTNIGTTLSKVAAAVNSISGIKYDSDGIYKPSDDKVKSIMVGIGYDATSAGYSVSDIKAYSKGGNTAIALAVETGDGGSNNDKYYFVSFTADGTTTTYMVSGKASIDNDVLSGYFTSGDAIFTSKNLNATIVTEQSPS